MKFTVIALAAALLSPAVLPALPLHAGFQANTTKTHKARKHKAKKHKSTT